MKQSAFIFAFLCSASAAAETQYVVASVANLRGSPQAEGALVARLPISMPVEISKTQGDWSAVTVQKKNGWVLSSLLSRERPSFTMMLALYDATPRSDIATRRKWVDLAQGTQGISYSPCAFVFCAGDRCQWVCVSSDEK